MPNHYETIMFVLVLLEEHPVDYLKFPEHTERQDIEEYIRAEYGITYTYCNIGAKVITQKHLDYAGRR